MHAVTAGAGPTIVLLHPEPGDASTFAAVIPRLADEYRVLALDLRGHGASAKPRGDYSVGTQASYVMRFLDAVGARRVVLVGNSYGAIVALHIAAHAPERVRGLVLSGTCAYADYHLPWRARLLSSWVGRLLAPVVSLRAVAREYRAQFADPSRVSTEQIDAVRAGFTDRRLPSCVVAAGTPTRLQCHRVAPRPHLGADVAAMGSERPRNAALLGSPLRAGPHGRSARTHRPLRPLPATRAARGVLPLHAGVRRHARPVASATADARFRSRRRDARTPPPTARDAGHRGTARRCAAGRSHPTAPRSAGSASNAQTSSPNCSRSRGIVEQQPGLSRNDLVDDPAHRAGDDRSRLPHGLDDRESETFGEALLHDDARMPLERVDDRGVLVGIVHRDTDEMRPFAATRSGARATARRSPART